MMAMSVNRRIEADLSLVMGQRDPAGMIRLDPRFPSGPAANVVPHPEAAHMTASGRTSTRVKKPLPAGGHPHMTMHEGKGGDKDSLPLPPNLNRTAVAAGAGREFDGTLIHGSNFGCATLVIPAYW